MRCKWAWWLSWLSGCQDAFSGCCDGEGVEAITYAGEACTNAEGGGGMAIFMFDLEDERVERSSRDSSDVEAILLRGWVFESVVGIGFPIMLPRLC